MNINTRASIISKIIEIAKNSPVKHFKMASAIILGSKLVGDVYSNTGQQYFKGHDIGSTHAELNAIKGYYRLSFDQKKGWIGKKSRSNKLNLVVIKIDGNEQLCNSRPCNNCLNIMKQVGIKKVYYSVSPNKIICENVRNMISIHMPYTVKLMEYTKGNYDAKEPDVYFEKLLKKNIPTIIRKYNLECFLSYNLSNVLSSYKIIINRDVIHFINKNEEFIISSRIIL